MAEWVHHSRCDFAFRSFGLREANRSWVLWFSGKRDAKSGKLVKPGYKLREHVAFTACKREHSSAMAVFCSMNYGLEGVDTELLRWDSSSVVDFVGGFNG